MDSSGLARVTVIHYSNFVAVSVLSCSGVMVSTTFLHCWFQTRKSSPPFVFASGALLVSTKTPQHTVLAFICSFTSHTNLQEINSWSLIPARILFLEGLLQMLGHLVSFFGRGLVVIVLRVDHSAPSGSQTSLLSPRLYFFHRG